MWIHSQQGHHVFTPKRALFDQDLAAEHLDRMPPSIPIKTTLVIDSWLVCEVPREEMMLCSGSDPESYITKYTLVHEEKRPQEPRPTAVTWGDGILLNWIPSRVGAWDGPSGYVQRVAAGGTYLNPAFSPCEGGFGVSLSHRLHSFMIIIKPTHPQNRQHIVTITHSNMKWTVLWGS